MNKLLAMTDEQLFEHVVAHVLRDNPQLKRGARMTGPVDVALGGELLSQNTTLEVNERQVLEARTWKVAFDADGNLANTEMSSRGWLHPYVVMFNDYNRDMLKRQVGESMVIMDSATYEPKTAYVTQGSIDAARNLMFRFAIAGEYKSEFTL